MISLLALERIAKKAGVKRISRQALEELREYTGEYAMDVAERAVRLSAHAGRRTVKAADVRFVAGAGQRAKK